MKKTEKILSLVFILIGVICFIISIILIPEVFNYDNKIDTVGTITEIVTRRDSDGDTTHDVYVSYSVDGREYENKLGGYSSSYKEGKEIEIYYHKDDPNKIGTKGLDLMILMVPGFGGIFFIIGIILLIKSDGKKKLLIKLRQTGIVVTANYVETKINTNYSVNGRNPYKIVCEWFSPEDNQMIQFVSDNLWNDPAGDIINNNITTFPVYINPQNRKQYVIDVNSVLPNAK